LITVGGPKKRRQRPKINKIKTTDAVRLRHRYQIGLETLVVYAVKNSVTNI